MDSGSRTAFVDHVRPASFRALLALLVVLFAAGAAIAAWIHVSGDERRRNMRVGGEIAQEVGGEIGRTARVLEAVKRTVVAMDWRQIERSREVRQALSLIRETQPALRDLFLVDPNGKIVPESPQGREAAKERAAGRIGFGQSGAIAVRASEPSAASGQLWVGMPTAGLSDADGKVVAGISKSVLDDLLTRIIRSPDEFVALVSEDGKPLLVYPRDTKVGPDSFWRDLVLRESNMWERVVTPADDRQRYVTLRHVPGLPLHLVYAVPLTTVARAWFAVFLPFLAVGLLCLVPMFCMSFCRSARLRSPAQAANDRAREFERAKLFLEANLVPAALYEGVSLTLANPAFRDLGDMVGGRPDGAPNWLSERLAERLVMEIREAEASVRHKIEIVGPDGTYSTIGVMALRLSQEPSRWLLIANNLHLAQARERQMRRAMLEIGHRSKNLMSVVQALARQIAMTTQDWRAFEDRFGQRLAGLAAAQDLLLGRASGARIGALLNTQIAHLGDHVGSRVVLEGPDLLLNPSVAQAIGMAIHELSTNAVKYGALSNDSGRVKIEWSWDEREDLPLVVAWREENGPPVEPPTRRGFGWKVVAGLTSASVAGTVRYDFPRTGVEWVLRLPAQAIVVPGPAQLRIVA